MASPSAVNIVEKAFQDLERTITPGDARHFSSTTLQGVRDAAVGIEIELAARQKFCNIRRLLPLLEGLNHYSKVLDVLCNGTDYLPWIWAPIKLVLQLASDYVEAFKTIIDAYSQIADCLPRFDVLDKALKDSPGFQYALAVFYADILRFHKDAYRFVKRPNWKIFFDSSWGRFQRRFKGILSDLAKHTALVDTEANAFNISEAHRWRIEARNWRDQSIADIKRKDKQESFLQYQSMLSWLDVKQSEQDDIFNCLSEAYCPGTCDWMLKNTSITSWMRHQPEQPYLWLKGKPGAGKSVLSTRIVTFLEKAPDTLLLRHFCSHHYSSSVQYGNILASIVNQLLRDKDDLLAYVYTGYILARKSTASATLEALILTLFAAVSTNSAKILCVRMILDGLDECDEDTQQRVVNFFGRIMALKVHGARYKVLLCSQDAGKLNKMLKKRKSIALEEEKEAVSLAIGIYTKQRLENMRLNEFSDIDITDADIEYTEATIAKKADGMFLWARLVLDVLATEVFDGQGMRDAVDIIPRELNEFYRRIWVRVEARFQMHSLEKIRRMLSWIMFAKRPLKKYELRTVLTFNEPNNAFERLPPEKIIELCKPLIEERKDSTYGFVHGSVPDFLISAQSGPIVPELQARHDQSLACLIYLRSATKIFSPEYSERNRDLRVLKWLHSFHLYATHFWIDHLLEFANLQPSLQLPRSTVFINVAYELANILSLANAALTNSDLTGKAAGDNDGEDVAAVIKPHCVLHDVITAELRSRDLAGVAPKDTTDNITAPRTELERMLNAYQSIVERLIQTPSYPNISAEDLAAFKQGHAFSAYTCRFSGCTWATVGFENDTLRCDHEIKHTQTLRCTVPDCGYDLPFSSSNALKSHHKTYHAPPPISKVARVAWMKGSCHACRVSMVSCDKNRPHCTRCLYMSNTCSYDVPPVKSSPKGIQRSLSLTDKADRSSSVVPTLDQLKFQADLTPWERARYVNNLVTALRRSQPNLSQQEAERRSRTLENEGFSQSTDYNAYIISIQNHLGLLESKRIASAQPSSSRPAVPNFPNFPNFHQTVSDPNAVDNNWSTSNKDHAPPVPKTLDMEDRSQFYGSKKNVDGSNSEAEAVEMNPSSAQPGLHNPIMGPAKLPVSNFDQTVADSYSDQLYNPNSSWALADDFHVFDNSTTTSQLRKQQNTEADTAEPRRHTFSGANDGASTTIAPRDTLMNFAEHETHVSLNTPIFEGVPNQADGDFNENMVFPEAPPEEISWDPQSTRPDNATSHTPSKPSNDFLVDYQRQCMLLELQDRKRLLTHIRAEELKKVIGD